MYTCMKSSRYKPIMISQYFRAQLQQQEQQVTSEAGTYD